MHRTRDMASPATAAPTATATTARASGAGRPVLRVLVLGAVLVGAIAAVHLSPIRAWLQDAEHIRQAIDRLGHWVYPVCALAVAVLVGCGVPRLLFCAVGGMAMGFWWGLAVSQAGGLLGYYAAFLFIRWGGRDWVLHRWPRLRKWGDLIHDQGVVGVILLRQVPMHGTLINLCLGLSHVKHRHFLIGTAIGLLPEAIPATLVGAGLMKASAKASAGYLAIAALTFAAIWIACAYGLRALRRRRPAAGEAAAALAEEATSLKGMDD